MSYFNKTRRTYAVIIQILALITSFQDVFAENNDFENPASKHTFLL